MRSIFGVLSLLVVLAIVGMLAKKQLGAVQEIKVPTVAGTPPVSISVDPASTAAQQSQQIQQQVKAAVEAAVQQPRVMPEEK